LPEKIPSVKIGDYSLPKITMGNDSFQGFTGLYPNPSEKRRIYAKLFSKPEGIAKLVSAAIEKGVNALAFGKNKTIVEAVDLVRKKNQEIKLVPMFYQVPLEFDGKKIPDTRLGATLIQHRKYIYQEDAYKEYIRTEEFKKKAEAKPLEKKEIDNLKVAKEDLRNLLNWFSEKKCVKILATCVELYALTGQLHLLEEIVETCDEFGFKLCAGSHMANVFDILDKENFHFESYFASINKIGFFMLPSRHTLLKSLSRIKEPVIAIKPLAGGRVPPGEALEYNFKLRDNIICMAGLSSIKEVNEIVAAVQSNR
jgi:hypothetical protein